MASVDQESPPVTPCTTQPRSLPGSPFAGRRQKRLFCSFRGKQHKGQKRLAKSPISSSSLRQMAKGQDSVASPQPAEVKVEVIASQDMSPTSPTKTKTPNRLHLLFPSSKKHSMATGSSTTSVESGYSSGGSRSDLLDGSPQPTQKEKVLKEKHPNFMHQVKPHANTGEKQSSEEQAGARKGDDDSPCHYETLSKGDNHPCPKLKRRSSLTRKHSERSRKSSDATTPTFCKIYKDIPRRYSQDKPRSMSLFLPVSHHVSLIVCGKCSIIKFCVSNYVCIPHTCSIHTNWLIIICIHEWNVK